MAELEHALLEITGAEIVDRELCVDRRPVADLLLIGADGMHLVLAVDGRAESCVARALEALAFAQRSGDLLARHVGAQVAGPASILLVALDGWSSSALEHLGGLARAGLRLFVRRRIESARGRSFALEELGPHGVPLPSQPRASRVASTSGQHASVALPGALESPFTKLPEETRALALELMTRLARIDPAVESERGPESMAWFVDGAPLCRLVGSGGRLEGHLAGSPIPHRIHSRAAAEVFLDWVLALHLERLEGGESEALDEYELVPSPRQPLLTREEIEAFHGTFSDPAGEQAS